jgi:hypothetical protein
MESQLTELFFESVTKTFHFLVGEYGFAAPVQEQDEKAGLSKVRYIGRNLAVECLLDARDLHVDCKVVRVVDGKIATDYAVDDRGQRVRIDLASLFRQRGTRERLFRKVGGMEFQERMQITLEDFAWMLQKYGADILHDLPKTLSS